MRVRNAVVSGLCCAALLLPRYAYPDEMRNDIAIGVKGGYSHVSGHYGDYLNGSAVGGLYILPYIGSFYMIEVDLHYAQYGLKNESGSALNTTVGGIGPLFYVQPFSFLQVYIGASITGNYFYLNANRLQDEQETLKAGYAGKAGFIFLVSDRIAFRAGCEYSQTFQSGSPFTSVQYFGAASYGALFWHAPSTAREADEYFVKGEQDFKRGRFDAAKRNFTKALAADGAHRESKRFLERIAQIEGQLALARDLISKKRPFEAIPVLERIADVAPEARDELQKIRSQLTSMVASLERTGIAAYEREDYRACIAAMQTLILIDPKNATAAIYLPRARKRLEALERLR